MLICDNYAYGCITEKHSINHYSFNGIIEQRTHLKWAESPHLSPTASVWNEFPAVTPSRNMQFCSPSCILLVHAALVLTQIGK